MEPLFLKMMWCFFFVNLAGYLSVKILRYCAEKWSRLSYFVRNDDVGGALVFASVRDFRKTRRVVTGKGASGKERRFRCVPEVLIVAKGTFKGIDRSFPDAFEFFDSGKKGDRKVLYRGISSGFLQTDLFVPFVSARYMSLEEQAAFFTVPKDYDEFIARKQKEMRRRDPRLRIEAWVNAWRHNGDVWISRFVGYGIATVVVLAMAYGFTSLHKMDEHYAYTTTINSSSNHVEATTIHSATPTTIINGDFTWLSKGTVVEDSLYLGGDLVALEYHNDEGERVGAFAAAAMNLKKGDAVIVRHGQIMARYGAYDYQNWVISSEEAEALIKTGKFHYLGSK
jgi:hypothetical protein